MIYRLCIRLLASIKGDLVYKYAYLWVYSFCKLCSFSPIKLSIPLSRVKVMGLSFPNPLGLAAGFDREGKLLRYSQALGFGFVEIGTINLDSQKELNCHAIEIIRNLKKAARPYQETNRIQKWGINLGSLRNTLDEQTVADYIKGMKLFWEYADYFVINLSRPESPVRQLNSDMEELNSFLDSIKHQQSKFILYSDKHIPIVVKIAIN